MYFLFLLSLLFYFSCSKTKIQYGSSEGLLTLDQLFSAYCVPPGQAILRTNMYVHILLVD